METREVESFLTLADELHFGRTAERLPDPWLDEHAPGAATRPRAGLQELLTLAGAGEGVPPVGAHIRRYYPRPDVAYVPLADALRLEWGLVWREGSATARGRAFTEAAAELVREPA
ncbi:hypothetical protein SAMN05421837_102993 [Amycolatopsis pretoriensis]|uniref:LysR substrate binding domain-containing protein n=1 Tax=Amycolatopsis pretoriensis TaxID=218821 RepID=A0A1H5QI71_9PSEU|nr:hypothetical protein [Amycolatopsis pretoriensis]SEF25068.1 hypothetical protein SAMN05421837_102993 [Amycolatopsis pretoriensis]